MPTTIKDNTGKIVGELTALSKYFRKQDETISEFTEQCKRLSPADKTELAIGAAQNMGWTVEQSA